MSQRQGASLAVWDVESTVTALACSPDDARVASGYEDGVIRIHDAHNGTLLVDPFKGHTREVESISFSPDGTLLISACADSNVRLWDARSGTPLISPFDSYGPIGQGWSTSFVAFSSDSARVISFLRTSDDCQVLVWDMRKNTMSAKQLKGHAGRIICAAISPDGTRVASSSNEALLIWEVHSGTLLAIPLKSHPRYGGICILAFSPDSTRIASCSGDGTLRTWDAYTGALLAGPLGVDNEVEEGIPITIDAVALSPDGTQIASAICRDDFHEIWVWDVRNGTFLTAPLEGHDQWISVVVFSFDGTRVISGSSDETIRVWNIRKDNISASTFRGHTENIASIAFASDDSRIVCGSDDGMIQVWDSQDGTLLASTQKGSSEITSIALSPDNLRILSSHSNHETYAIQVRDMLNGALLIGPLEGHSKRINSAVFSPDGTHIVSGSSDCTVRLWDAHKGVPLTSPFEGHSGPVNSVAFSLDGTRIASGSDDCTTRVWDVHAGNLLISPCEAKEHAVDITSVAFSPDGTHIISGCDDGTIQVWDTRNATLLKEFVELLGAPIVKVAFSPDGTRIFSVSEGCGVWVWDVENDTQLTRRWLSDVNDCQSFTRLVAITSNGTRIATCINDEEGDIYDPFNRSIESREVLFDDHQRVPYLDQWTMYSDGWVLDAASKSRALLWLPADLRDIFPRPPANLLIHPKGPIATRWRNLLLGESWRQCYDSSRTASSDTP